MGADKSNHLIHPMADVSANVHLLDKMLTEEPNRNWSGTKSVSVAING